MPIKERMEENEDHDQSRKGSLKCAQYVTNNTKSTCFQIATLSASYQTFEKALVLLETLKCDWIQKQEQKEYIRAESNRIDIVFWFLNTQ